MSTLTENVEKVKNAHANLKTAIAAKGVDVPEGTKLTGMPALVDQIQTGGTPEPNVPKACFTGYELQELNVSNLIVADFTTMTNLWYCFAYCNLYSLTLPAGFGQNATNLTQCFYETKYMTSLTLPAGFGQNATALG